MRLCKTEFVVEWGLPWRRLLDLAANYDKRLEAAEPSVARFLKSDAQEQRQTTTNLSAGLLSIQR
jgi:hypothetical protein